MRQRTDGQSKGVDVSHWQGSVNWEKVKAAGYEFMIAKATEGTGMIDDTFEANIKGAHAVGMAVGAYHFCRASNVSEAQAEAAFFASVIDSVGVTLDIPPVLDIETVHASTREEITSIAHAFCEAITARYNVTPMIYSYPWFTSAYLDSTLSKYHLWLADYTNNQPQDRSGWTEWTFLQFSDKGTVPGIAGPVDVNVYNGRVEDFMFKLSKDAADTFIKYCKLQYAEAVSDQDRQKWNDRAIEARKAAGFAEDYEPDQ